MPQEEAQAKVRLDRWLWAARFYKTRSLAAKAVHGGQVQVDGQRAKPSRAIRGGETLRIRRGNVEFTVQVLAVSDRRRGAPEARLLYQETEASVAARQEAATQRRFHGLAPPPQRPDRRDRRRLRQLRRGDDE